MKHRAGFYAFTLLFIFSIFSSHTLAQIKYSVDITDSQKDVFCVTVQPGKLLVSDTVFCFCSTVPGTYDKLDFGRFVTKVQAFDSTGRELSVARIDTNLWRIQNPEKLDHIYYEIEDTYDSKRTARPVLPMGGTAIEEDFAIFNTFGVLGYFDRLKNQPVELKIKFDEEWETGTALNQKDKHTYTAVNYYQLIDSPLLLGKLSRSSFQINGIDVEIYSYSPESAYKASKILSLVNTSLTAAAEFIGKPPVSKYTFLFCIPEADDKKAKRYTITGAHEHNSSSLYYLIAREGTVDAIKTAAAHEFLHILTPLHAHSDRIHSMDLQSPVPSKHLWFYEGVTEWAAIISQLRSGFITLSQYLSKLTEYLKDNDHCDSTESMCQMSLNSYTEAGNKKFITFYRRGPVAAALLDLKLLSLSKGKYGLRELLLSLVNEYGSDSYFKDEEFFDIIVKKTYPEIAQFLNDYICGIKPMPVEELFRSIGISYYREKISTLDRPFLGTSFALSPEDEIIAVDVTGAAAFGLRDKDVLIELMGERCTKSNFRDLISYFVQEMEDKKPGDPFTIKVRRGNKELRLNCQFTREIMKHVFTPMDKLTPEQSELRKIWLGKS